MQGRSLYVKLGDKDVEYNKNFKLILHTKLSNPHYPPEIQAETTLINFTVTESGLEDQLLALVVNKERPDLEETKTQLIIQNTDFTIKLKQVSCRIVIPEHCLPGLLCAVLPCSAHTAMLLAGCKYLSYVKIQPATFALQFTQNLALLVIAIWHVQLEDDLLYKLSSAEGDMTEDLALIESLEESKRVADEISEKVAEAKTTEEQINEARNKVCQMGRLGLSGKCVSNAGLHVLNNHLLDSQAHVCR